MKTKPTYQELEAKIKELQKQLSNKNSNEYLKESENRFKQKETEQVLKIERNRLKSIMDTNPSGIYIVDNNYNIEYINPVVEKEFGKINGRKCYSYFHAVSEVCKWCKNKEVFTGKSVKWEWYSEKNDKYYDLFGTPLKNPDGSISKFEMIFDITERKKNEKKLKQRENYLVALNKATEILSTGDPKIQIQKFTETIGKVVNASRTYIFKNHTNEKGELLLSQIAEYVADSIKPEIDNPQLQNLSYNDWIPRWHKILKKGDIIKGKVADFPQIEREILESQEIKAVLIIPIIIGKEFWGFIGFDNCINDNDWQTAEVEYLKASAGKISTKLEEHRKQKMLKNENKRFHITMDSIDTGIYVADMQTHELLFINEKFRKLFGNKVGEKCYNALQGLDAPCSFCTNSKLLDKNGNSKEPYVWEFQNKITKQWYHCRDQAIQWTDERFVRLEIAIDITERKETELIIHKQNQEYEALNEELRITNEELQIGKAQIQGINSQLNATINALPDIMFETNEKGKIYYYHAPKTELLYAKPKDFLGKNLDEVLPKNAATICNNAIKEAIETGNHFGANYSLQLPQGLSWFELSIALKKDNNTDEKRVIMLVRDITTRKKTVKSLSENKNRLKAFSEVANEAIFFSEKGICIEANQRARKLFGYTFDELIGMHGTGVIADESKKLVTKNMLSGYEKPYDAVAQKKDGTKFHAEFHGRMYKYKDKEVRVTAVRDITDRKKAEQEIKESERKLKEAQQIAHVGHWELDIVNNVLTWSDEIYRMFGLTPQEFGATYEAFFNNIHPDDVEKAYQDSIENKTPYKIEHRLLLKTGEVKYVLEQCNTKFDKHGKPLLSFGTVFDITEFKKIDKLKIAKAKLEKSEQKLIEQNKEYESLNEEYKATNEELFIAKEKTEENNQKLQSNNIEIEKINEKLEDYSYTVSHDLKEPIRSIRTFSQFILEDYADKFDEEATDYLNRIIRASSRMANMIEDLLELSRVGRVDIEFTKTNISILIQELEDSLIQKIRKTNTKISYANLPEIICQPVWIKAVFQNLITNSINYNSKDEKEILITHKKFNNKHEFAIKDNGNGIPENQFVKIFGLFRKSHKNKNTKSSGAGLAIVSAVIEEHKGKIWVDWSEINTGTIIKFTISK